MAEILKVINEAKAYTSYKSTPKEYLIPPFVGKSCKLC